MMIRFLFALLMFAAFSQATFMPQAHLIQVFPDVTLVLLLVWSAFRGVPEGWFTRLVSESFLMCSRSIHSVLMRWLSCGGADRWDVADALLPQQFVFPLLLSVVATMVHAVVLLLLRSTDGIGVPFSTAHSIYLPAIAPQCDLRSAAVFGRGWMDRRMDDAPCLSEKNGFLTTRPGVKPRGEETREQPPGRSDFPHPAVPW